MWDILFSKACGLEDMVVLSSCGGCLLRLYFVGCCFFFFFFFHSFSMACAISTFMVRFILFFMLFGVTPLCLSVGGFVVFFLAAIPFSQEVVCLI